MRAIARIALRKFKRALDDGGSETHCHWPFRRIPLSTASPFSMRLSKASRSCSGMPVVSEIAASSRLLRFPWVRLNSERENGMKRYFIAVAFILGAPQSLLAQADAFYVVLDNTTNACRVVTSNELQTQKARYKQMGQYASKDEAIHALNAMIGGQCPSHK